MQISRVKISKILGIDELEFEAGKFNAFTGGNEQGKTSALNAVKAAIGRDGDDATLLRKGAEKGEIVIVFDDGTTITKTVTESGAKTSVSGGPDGKVSATQTMIKGLTDSLSVNPVDFIRSGDTPGDKRQRLQWLLECLPVKIDQARLEEIAGAAVRVASPSWPAFDQLEAIRKTIFDDRTATNRAIAEKQGSINQLEQTLPDDEPGRVAGDPATLQTQLEEMDRANAAALTGVSDKLADYERASAERLSGITAAATTEIDALKAQIRAREEERDAALAEERKWIAEARTGAETRRSQLRTEHAEARAPHQATLDAIRAGANAIAKAAQTRAHIKEFETGISRLEEDAKRMTRRLDEIQDYKSELLANIPVDGLTVDDGEIYRHGVPFNRLNTAQQVDMAVEIAKLRASRAGIICVDGIESLDNHQYEVFRDKCVASGLQLFVTRVDPHGGALAVQTA